jgi:hypothetical protein
VIDERSPPDRSQFYSMTSSAGEQSWRHVDAERLGGFEVDCEHLPSRLYDRQIARLFTLEKAAGVEAD